MARDDGVPHADASPPPDRLGPAASPWSPAPPTLLAGRYRLEGRLGSGAVADVYRAVDTSLGRTVAVKVFRPGTGLNLAEQRRFEQEGRTLAGLQHAHLVALYDTGVDDGHPYLVLQYVEGITLSDRLQDGPLPPLEVARIGTALADALSHVHAHRVMHRDVKPSNVLLARSGHVHLTDFGIAQIIDAPAFTATGMLVGTAAYLAPEQVCGDRVTPASDVYALGLVLLECLTGQRAYRGGVAEVAVARLTKPPQIPDDVGAEWRALLTAMTAQDPTDRPRALAVAAHLGRLALVGMVDAAMASTGSVASPGSAASPAHAAEQGRSTRDAGAPAEPVIAASSHPPPRDVRTPGPRASRRRLAGVAACLALVAGGAAAAAISAGSRHDPSRTPDQAVTSDRAREPQQPRPNGPTDRHIGADASSPDGIGDAAEVQAPGEHRSAEPTGATPDLPARSTPTGGIGAPSGPTGTASDVSPTATTSAPGHETGDGVDDRGKRDKDKEEDRPPLLPLPSLSPLLPLLGG